MKTDLRLDLASFLPPVTFFAVITAFLHPYVSFPLIFPVMSFLFIVNGGEILFSGYLKKKRGFEGSHNWLREFAIFQIVFSVLWLLIAGYIIPFGNEPPRTEYAVYYFLVFPVQWLLTMKLRNNMPPEKILTGDLQELIRALKGNRRIILILQFSLAMIFLFGFRLASGLPLVVQIAYWLNLAINFILMIFTNRQLEELTWTGHGIKNKPVTYWFRLPLVLFLLIAVLSLFAAWKLPVLSLRPFFDLIVVLIRWLAQRIIKPDPKTVMADNPEPIDLGRSVSDIMNKQDGTGTSFVAGVGDIIIRMSIFALLAAFLLAPFIRFLFIGKKKRSSLIRQILKDIKETLNLFFTPRNKGTAMIEVSGSRIIRKKERQSGYVRKTKPGKGSIESLFADLCHWGGIKGYPYERSTPPLEYLVMLAEKFPEKSDLLVEAGLAVNRYMYGKYPVTRSERAETKKTVKRIIN